MTWQAELAAVIGGVLTVLALVHRLDMPRLMAWLEYRAQTQREAAQTHHAWSSMVRKLTAESDESHKRERVMRTQLEALSADLYGLRIELERTREDLAEVRTLLERQRSATQAAIRERDELARSIAAGERATVHRLANPPHGREQTGPFPVQKDEK